MNKHTLYIYIIVLAVLVGCKPQNTPEQNPQNDSVSTHRDLDYLFDIESVPQITLTLTEEDWNTYLSNFDRWEDNSLYVPAGFEWHNLYPR